MDLYYGLPESSRFRQAVGLNAFSQLLAVGNEIQLDTLRLFLARINGFVIAEDEWARITFFENESMTVDSVEAFFVHISVYVSLMYTPDELRRILLNREYPKDRGEVGLALAEKTDNEIVNIFVAVSSFAVTVFTIVGLIIKLRNARSVMTALEALNISSARVASWAASARGSSFLGGAAAGGLDVGLASSTATAIATKAPGESAVNAGMMNEVGELSTFRVVSTQIQRALGRPGYITV